MMNMKNLLALLVVFVLANLCCAAADLAAGKQGETSWAVVAEVRDSLNSDAHNYDTLNRLAEQLNSVRTTDFPDDHNAAFLTLLDLNLKIVSVTQGLVGNAQAQIEKFSATISNPESNYPTIPGVAYSGMPPELIKDSALRKRYEDELATRRLLSGWKEDIFLLTKLRDRVALNARTLIKVRLKPDARASVEAMLAKYFPDPAFSKQFLEAIPKD